MKTFYNIRISCNFSTDYDEIICSDIFLQSRVDKLIFLYKKRKMSFMVAGFIKSAGEMIYYVFIIEKIGY